MDRSSGVQSARNRAPSSGRSNRGQLNEDAAPPRSKSSRQSNGSIQYTPVNTSRRIELNDPIQVFRPYSPDGRMLDSYKYNPPVLPTTVSDPLLMRHETGRRAQGRPLTCPREWIDKLQQPDILDKSSFITEIDEASKTKMCRSFVERNRDRLWKFDSNNFNKTPRTIANEILEDPFFVTRMAVNLNKERMFKLSNSEKTAEVLTDPNNYRMTADPFAASLTTSRDMRKSKMETMLAPALLQYGRQHQRGYDHAIDFGNFSKYNGVLKTNIATTMNR